MTHPNVEEKRDSIKAASSSAQTFFSVESFGPTEGLLQATMRHLDFNLKIVWV
jgi:hypothetical protein